MSIIVVCIFVALIVVLILIIFRFEIQHAENERIQRVKEQKALEENHRKIRQLRAKVVRKQILKNE